MTSCSKSSPRNGPLRWDQHLELSLLPMATIEATIRIPIIEVAAAKAKVLAAGTSLKTPVLIVASPTTPDSSVGDRALSANTAMPIMSMNCAPEGPEDACEILCQTTPSNY